MLDEEVAGRSRHLFQKRARSVTGAIDENKNKKNISFCMALLG